MVRVVFDTVIFVRSLMNPSGLWGRLVFDRPGAYQLAVSEPVVAEILEVIQRPDLVRKYRGLATRNPDSVLALLTGAYFVNVDDIPPISRDPKDDKFLATALAANADYLVTEDEDLLVLREHQGIPIVTAHTFLRVLEGKSDHAQSS